MINGLHPTNKVSSFPTHRVGLIQFLTTPQTSPRSSRSSWMRSLRLRALTRRLRLAQRSTAIWRFSARFFRAAISFSRLRKLSWRAAIELAAFDGRADGAAGVVAVAAVGVLAVRGDGFDVGETFAQGGFIGPHLDFAHARIVDEHAAAGQRDEFARGGGVAAFAGGFVDLAGPLPFLAVELVDEGGFADAAGADDAHGDAFFEVFFEGFEALALERAGDVDVRAAPTARRFPRRPARFVPSGKDRIC